MIYGLLHRPHQDRSLKPEDQGALRKSLGINQDVTRDSQCLEVGFDTVTSNSEAYLLLGSDETALGAFMP